MVFRIYFLFPEGNFKKEQDKRMKFRRTNKVGKSEVKKAKTKEAKCRSCCDHSTLPINLARLFSILLATNLCLRFFKVS